MILVRFLLLFLLCTCFRWFVVLLLLLVRLCGDLLLLGMRSMLSSCCLFLLRSSLSSVVLNLPSGYHLHFALSYFDSYEKDCPGLILLISSIPFTSVIMVPKGWFAVSIMLSVGEVVS